MVAEMNNKNRDTVRCGVIFASDRSQRIGVYDRL